MLVRRRGSRKRGERYYEVLYFYYGESLREVTDFLGDQGKLIEGADENVVDIFSWIILNDGRQIIPTQYLLKDKRERILTFDPTIFIDWFIVYYAAS